MLIIIYAINIHFQDIAKYKIERILNILKTLIFNNLIIYS